MNKLSELLQAYSSGEQTLEEVNRALAKEGAAFRLDPERNILTEQERASTTVGERADEIQGYGLLDTGTGSLEKVEVRNGILQNMDCGEMYALCIIGGVICRVKGSKLILYLQEKD